jgi:formate dehydrogenase subunit delta
MKLDKLIRMANEIARNLRSQPGDRAVAATADHLRSFWTPGMRATLIAHAKEGGAGLDPIALQALRVLAPG